MAQTADLWWTTRHPHGGERRPASRVVGSRARREQTKYICGWSDKCLYDKRLNATHDMLAQALENLEDKFLAVGACAF